VRRVAELPEPLRDYLGGSEYLWCRHCCRAFRRDELQISEVLFSRAADEPAGRATELRVHVHLLDPYLFCANEDCCMPLAVYHWDVVRAAHPEYPRKPRHGVRYTY
jgi:hypothetical protein